AEKLENLVPCGFYFPTTLINMIFCNKKYKISQFYILRIFQVSLIIWVHQARSACINIVVYCTKLAEKE
ncbi:MAG: hypothetical protein C4322_22950, partial [Mastigocladus sp. ERB_26_1]